MLRLVTAGGSPRVLDEGREAWAGKVAEEIRNRFAAMRAALPRAGLPRSTLMEADHVQAHDPVRAVHLRHAVRSAARAQPSWARGIGDRMAHQDDVRDSLIIP